MAELDRMIIEVNEWRIFHREQYQRGVKGATIEAAACAIREKALRDAKRAILNDQPGARTHERYDRQIQNCKR